ncbi:hypothetical protein ASPCAL06042 [Aspergillus calidoustus]|uniref:Uncharacterized protein n=1 Tax=Aspergillus calidoustus TaxID=454130 RepID=A0A0U5FZX5_ASPCI|nr:hypothetical protein ASPCAL06042 [Aspergillus calidoustus]
MATPDERLLCHPHTAELLGDTPGQNLAQPAKSNYSAHFRDYKAARISIHPFPAVLDFFFQTIIPPQFSGFSWGQPFSSMPVQDRDIRDYWQLKDILNQVKETWYTLKDSDAVHPPEGVASQQSLPVPPQQTPDPQSQDARPRRRKKRKPRHSRSSSSTGSGWGGTTLVNGRSGSSAPASPTPQSPSVPSSVSKTSRTKYTGAGLFQHWLRSAFKGPGPQPPRPKITPGRECLRINGKRCWHIDYDTYPVAEEVAENVRAHVEHYINGPGGVAAEHYVGTFLLGPNLKDLTPTVLVCCDSKSKRKYLEETLLKKRMPKQSWLHMEISNDFPHKRVKAHLSASGTHEPIDGQASDSPGPRTVSLGTFITPPSCIDEHSGWDVYVRGAPPDGRITFPATFYVGTNLRLLHKITIGRMVVLEGDERLYGITVGHAITTKGSLHADRTDPCSSPKPDMSGDPSEFRAVGTVVNSTRGLKGELDWALVRFSSKFQVADDLRQEDLAISKELFNFSKPPAERDRQVLIMRTSQHISGRLRPYINHISVPGDEFLVKTWMVELDGGGSAEPGDCGSLVVDFRSNKICGFVSYGADDGRTVFIVPAWDIFCEIQGVMDKQIAILPFVDMHVPPEYSESTSSSASSEYDDDDENSETSENFELGEVEGDGATSTRSSSNTENES